MGPNEDEMDELNDLYAEFEDEIAEEANKEFEVIDTGVI